jgi:hypothetical protein
MRRPYKLSLICSRPDQLEWRFAMKKWTIILLCLLSLLFLCVTATGTAGNKALEEKIVAQEKQG